MHLLLLYHYNNLFDLKQDCNEVFTFRLLLNNMLKYTTYLSCELASRFCCLFVLLV